MSSRIPPQRRRALHFVCTGFLLAAPVLPAGCAAPVKAPSTASRLVWQPLLEPGSGGAMVDVSVCPWESNRLLVAGDMLGVGLSTDRGNSWGVSTGFQTWEMASFTWHPTNRNEVWVGSMGGPYRSRDGGKTWTLQRAGMPAPAGWAYTAPVEKVIFDPNDPRHLLAIGGSSRHWEGPGDKAWGAIWESRDGGDSWSRLSTITKDGSSLDAKAQGVNVTWASFAPGSNTLLYATADDAGFLASTDGGKTWTKRNEGLPITDHRIALHPRDGQTLWASVGNTLPDGAKERVPGGVYKTVDGGLHWTRSSNGLGQIVTGADPNQTSRYRALVVAPSDPKVLYTNDSAWNTGVIYKSEDGGASWRAVASKGNVGADANDPAKRRAFQLQTATPAGLGLEGIAVDPRDAKAAFGFNSEFIARTLDGGGAWDDATSRKVGDGWIGRGYSGWCTTNFRFSPYTRGMRIFQGLDASRGWVSSDDGKSWFYGLGAPDPWGGGRDATFLRDGTIYATLGAFNFTGIGRTTDGGKNWTVLRGAEHGLPDFYKGSAPGGITALPDGSKVWAVVDGQLLVSTDRGEHWAPAGTRKGLGWIATDPKQDNRFVVSSESGLLLTDDGTKFVPLGGPRTREVNVSFDGARRVLLAVQSGDRPGIWRCDLANPASPVWTRLSDERWASAVAADPSDPDRLVYATNQNPYADISQATGVWCSSDGGASWAQSNTGLGMLRGGVLAFDPLNPTHLVFGTNGRGFFETNWPKNLAFFGTKRYISTPDDTKFAAPPDESRVSIREFGPAGVDYTYGQDWKNGASVSTGSENGQGFLKVDATEFGGAGVVLNGANLAPAGQTLLVLRARLLPGNAAQALAVHLIPKTGDAHNYSFDLSKLNARSFTTLSVPLGAGDFSNIQQVQLQGANFSAGAKPLKIEIASLSTTVS